MTNSMEYVGRQRQPSVFTLPNSVIYLLKTCSLFRDSIQLVIKTLMCDFTFTILHNTS